MLVPEAEPHVAALRRRHDPAAALGVPAHVTLLYPFLPPALVTRRVLRRAAAALHGQPAFRFRLAAAGAFPGVLWLAPEPGPPFVAMTRALARAFPDWPPYGGVHRDIVPHLSVAQGDESTLRTAGGDLEAELAARGPIAAHCTAVAVLGRHERHWSLLHLLALG